MGTSMPQFDPHTLVIVDDDYDQRHASDGHSRYGAYFQRRAGLPLDGEPPYTAPQFAVVAWGIAGAPVMSPGYVRVRPDVHDITAHVDDDGGLLLRVEIRLRHRALADRPCYLGDWEQDRNLGADQAWPRLDTPYQPERAALLTTATLLLPVHTGNLIAPTGIKPDRTMIGQARDNVAAVAAHINTMAYAVNELTGAGR
ncbi:hypothetical protein J5Y04_28525 [Kitasatospora sp. RG8]|uniref:hypothetical protein n=1 Tax=Kitasatospora sp. RG8 TaxID=2820815 RepID=UPI001ADF5555|nr:hypothetical protein [Kitasatospora sp. RG8]MBP0453461.1 hypothetical protein [Kitasatospora sp. RG8]